MYVGWEYLIERAMNVERRIMKEMLCNIYVLITTLYYTLMSLNCSFLTTIKLTGTKQ